MSACPHVTQCGLGFGLPGILIHPAVWPQQKWAKIGGMSSAPFWMGGSWVPIYHNVALAEAYFPTKWHLGLSSDFATTYGRNIDGGAVPLCGGGAGSLSNTMWLGHTRMPSFIVNRPAVWPQYTNVTDRQTNRTDRTGQRSDRIGRTVLQTVAQKCQ